MIDKKKIEEATEKHMLEQFYSKGKAEYPIECGKIDRQCQKDFKAGIEWFKKNIWHNAKEEPKIDELLIAQYIKDHRVKYMMYCWDSLGDCSWAEDVIDFHITKWCYLKDLI